MAVANKHKIIGSGNFTIFGLDEDLTPDTANDYLATYDASAGQNKKVLLDNLGLGGGGNAFTIFQPDAGTAPTADSSTDTLTMTSSDSSITITGNSTTDTLDFLLKTTDLSFSSSASSTVPLTLAGSASQTASLMEVEDSGATQLWGLDSDGTMRIRSSASSADPCILVLSESNLGLGFSSTGSNGQAHIYAGSSARYDFSKNGFTAFGGVSSGNIRSGNTGGSSVPMFTFSSDTNTGMYRSSADVLGFTSGATATLLLSTTQVDCQLPLKVPAYATGSLPTASSYTQCIVYDSTTNQFKGSDGTSWNVLG